MMLGRLLIAFRGTPTAVSVGIGAIPIGLVTLILGEGASRALTDLGGRSTAYVLGLLLFTGGILATVAIMARSTFVELIGTAAIAAGFGLYGAAVLIGLGTNGLIAGTLALSVMAGFVGRIFLLTSLAHQVDGLATENEDSGRGS